ncbi:MAG: glycosyltransferase [Oscillochloridaceae bacterium]|nr:glycosyltransferase [Chloroflexaceae bacterium]MDW8388722.1 glycosyltransferase [Oscillochloridaceae bacterium]
MVEAAGRHTTPRILIVLEYYLPGFKSGGPIRSIANLVERLGDQFDFYILARDRDAGDRQPYPDVQCNAWVQVGKGKVYYASPDRLSFRHLLALVGEVRPAIIYLNSFFAPLARRFLVLRRLGLLPGSQVILAPRGEFSPGALKIRTRKKQLYINLSLHAGLANQVIWQASTPLEQEDIRRIIGERAQIRIASNMTPAAEVLAPKISRISKRAGNVRFVFLSRLVPKKNLKQAIAMLAPLQGEISLDVYGPIEEKDLAYWHECQALIARSPKHVSITYHGELAHSEVVSTLAQSHFFLFPTLGENFGHVILEALLAGCPVLLSDQTPWFTFADRPIGWGIPLDDEMAWRTTLQHCVDMDDKAYQQHSESARAFAMTFANNPAAIRENVELFASALGLPHAQQQRSLARP